MTTQEDHWLWHKKCGHIGLRSLITLNKFITLNKHSLVTRLPYL